MRQLDAFRETVKLLEGVPDDSSPFLPESLRPGHIRDMLRRAETTKMSPAKLGRWLGWAQAAVVAMEWATLEEMKELNRSFADGDDE